MVSRQTTICQTLFLVRLKKDTTTTYKETVSDVSQVVPCLKYPHLVKLPPEKTANTSVLKQYILAVYHPFNEKLIMTQNQDNATVVNEEVDTSDDITTTKPTLFYFKDASQTILLQAW